MKAGIIIWSLGTLVASGASFAYSSMDKASEVVTRFVEPGQYCAQMRDGKMIVLFDGKEISGDIFLKNGSTIKPDGTVITKDGVRFSLKEGQCIDQNGAVTGESMKKPY
jgi:hypothetical protein